MSKKSDKKKDAPRHEPRKGRAGLLLLAALILLMGLVVLIAASGWLHAQSAKWPAAKAVADRLATLVPDALRAPGYGRAMASENASVRKTASEALAEMGPEAQNAVPNLVRALKHKQAEVRRSALDALARMGENAEEAVPKVAESLQDSSADVRATAADALGRIKARTRESIPALKAALNDIVPEVREAAQYALDKLRPGADSPPVDTDAVNSVER